MENKFLKNNFEYILDEIYSCEASPPKTSLNGASITGSVFQPRPCYWLLFSPYGLSLSSLYI